MAQLINTKDWGHSIYKAYLDINGDYTKFQNQVTGVVAVCIAENEQVASGLLGTIIKTKQYTY